MFKNKGMMKIFGPEKVVASDNVRILCCLQEACDLHSSFHIVILVKCRRFGCAEHVARMRRQYVECGAETCWKTAVWKTDEFLRDNIKFDLGEVYVGTGFECKWLMLMTGGKVFFFFRFNTSGVVL